MREVTAAVDELARLVRWTGHGVRDVGWREIERELGVAIPPSFKAYVSRFPAGTFQTCLHVEEPHSPTDTRGYVERLYEELKALRVVTRGRRNFEYDIYPRLPGLLPWGRIGADYVFCWLVDRGSVNTSQVVFVDTAEPSARPLDGTMVDCIIDLLKGRIPELVDVAEASTPPRFDALRLGPFRPYRRPAEDWDLDPEGMMTVPLDWVDRVGELLELVGGVPSLQGVEWSTVEQELRHPLPRDYKKLIEVVGPGRYGDIAVGGPVAMGSDRPSVIDLTAQALEDVNTGALVPARLGPVVWGRAPGGWHCGWAPGEYPADQRPVMLFHRDEGSSGRQRSMTGYLASHVRDPTDWTAAWWRIGEPE